MSPRSSEAVQFCLAGAVHHCYRYGLWEKLEEVARFIVLRLKRPPGRHSLGTVCTFNDYGSWDDINYIVKELDL